MVLQRKKNTSLLELLESHSRGSTPEVAIQTWPPTPSLPIPPFLKKQTRRGKGIKKGRKYPKKAKLFFPKILNPKNGQKLPKGRSQRKSSAEGIVAETISEHRPRILTWNPPFELDEAPLPMDSSIRDFQKGKAGYVANALEQPLLLPQDMANLGTLKKLEVFLMLKRDLAMAIQTTNIAEEWVDDAHAQLKEEEACQIAVVKTLAMAEKKIKDLRAKLIEADRE